MLFQIKDPIQLLNLKILKRKKKTINFDENGICDSCNYNSKKNKINWKERELELSELCDKYRKKMVSMIA